MIVHVYPIATEYGDNKCQNSLHGKKTVIHLLECRGRAHTCRSAQYSCEIYYVKNLIQIPQAVTASNDFHSRLTVRTYGNHAGVYQVMIRMVIPAYSIYGYQV